MLDTLLDTLKDSALMLPFLFLAFLLIETVGHKAMGKLRNALSNEGIGVVAASALGIFPQCGFSAAVVNLYAERLVKAGAVIAVFISTSDEALPMLFGAVADSPEVTKKILPLILIKFVWAVIAGFITNFVFKIFGWGKIKPHTEHHHEHHHEHSAEHIHEGGEHHHCAHCDSNEGILENALKRTLWIFLYVLVISLVLNFVIYFVGMENIEKILMTDSIFQPFIAGVVGLIPNCAASVALTELYISGALSFASLVAGLCSGAGIGLVVLFRVNKSIKQNLIIVGMLYILSVAAGLLVSLLPL